MLPNQNINLESDFDVEETETSKTYKMNTTRLTINGKTDGIESILQAIYKILNTERYENPVYSFNYGIELIDLYGEDTAYVCPELKRRIHEALIQDERITDVDSFDFEINKSTITVNFTVKTIFGDVETQKVVNN